MRIPAALFIIVAALTAFPANFQPDPVYRETEIRHARPRLSGEIFDPQESDPALKSTFSAADRKAERAVGNVPRDSAFITHFWKVKKRILKEEYALAWKTPAEMNPQIRYANYGQPRITNMEDQALRRLVAVRLSSASEAVVGVQRDFDGIASVSTKDSATDTAKQYRFKGHDQTWSFLDVFEIVE